MPSKITLKSFMAPSPNDHSGRAMTSVDRTRQRREQRIRAKQRSVSAAKAEIRQVIKESLQTAQKKAVIIKAAAPQVAPKEEATKEPVQETVQKEEVIKEPVTVQKEEVIVKEVLKDVQQKNDEINFPETDRLFTLRVFQLKQMAFMYPVDYYFHVNGVFTQPSTFSSRLTNFHNAMVLRQQKDDVKKFVKLMQEEADQAIDRNFLECVHALERLIM